MKKALLTNLQDKYTDLILDPWLKGLRFLAQVECCVVISDLEDGVDVMTDSIVASSTEVTVPIPKKEN